ncbi:hypothetical protein BGW42_002797 [Actinomortierella wolfii]|nr:hypothetical protein BGW42_002797 [Actinomortierella wolfii]
MHMFNALIAFAVLFMASGTWAAPTQGGSTCHNPHDEPSWGAATEECCQGRMSADRRCHDIPDCGYFNRCCIRVDEDTERINPHRQSNGVK